MNYSIINLAKAHLIFYPCPLNLNFLWNYGFLVGVVFTIQVLTGVLLATCYTPEASLAFYSVQSMVRELWCGWCIRYIHSTGASFIFILTYIHILKGLNYSYSYLPLSWLTGVILYFMCIAIAFLGYVLPWGQMSFWGATVITNLLYFIPGMIAWLCGGYTVGDATLKRFFILHFILPFITLSVIFIHIFFLHLQGSNNPLGYDTPLKIPFYPNLLCLDIKALTYLLTLFLTQSFFGILPLCHSDNSIIADRYSTPIHIVPEWYFLAFYSILKVIPHKTGGVLVMLAALLVLIIISEQRNISSIILFKFNLSARDFSSSIIWYICSFYALMCVGYQLPTFVFIFYGRIFLIFYFVCIVFTLVQSRKTYYDYSSQANI